MERGMISDAMPNDANAFFAASRPAANSRLRLHDADARHSATSDSGKDGEMTRNSLAIPRLRIESKSPKTKPLLASIYG